MPTDLIDRWLDLPHRGRTLVREIAGPNGAPVLMLLHGLGATGRLNWGRCYPALAEHFRVISIDHRGHGRGLRTGRFRLEDCADDVAAIATVLGIETFIPVGYSMGGPIAMLLWRQHRQRVSGLVLCATSLRFAGGAPFFAAQNVLPMVANVIRILPQPAHRLMLERMLGRIDHPAVRRRVAEELQGHDPATVLQAAGAVGSFSARAWIAEIDVPTAVIVTARDNLVPPPRQRRMAELIPGARVYEIDADHVACVERADLFVPALLGACLDVARGPGSKGARVRAGSDREPSNP